MTSVSSGERTESSAGTTTRSGVSGGSDPDDESDSSSEDHDVERSERGSGRSSSGLPVAPTVGGSSSGSGSSGAARTPSNPAPPPAASATGLLNGMVLRWSPERTTSAQHKKKLQVSEYDGQHRSVVTWLQQVNNAVEMAAAVMGEDWDNEEWVSRRGQVDRTCS